MCGPTTTILKQPKGPGREYSPLISLCVHLQPQPYEIKQERENRLRLCAAHRNETTRWPAFMAPMCQDPRVICVFFFRTRPCLCWLEALGFLPCQVDIPTPRECAQVNMMFLFRGNMHHLRTAQRRESEPYLRRGQDERGRECGALMFCLSIRGSWPFCLSLLYSRSF